MASQSEHHTFLKGLDDDSIAKILQCGQLHTFAAGTELFHEGEEARSVYLIHLGAVALDLYIAGCGHVHIETLKAGDMAGWSWLNPPYHWHFQARVEEPSTITILDAEKLRELCDADPHVGYELLKRFSRLMSHRLQVARLQLMEAYGSKRDW